MINKIPKNSRADKTPTLRAQKGNMRGLQGLATKTDSNENNISVGFTNEELKNVLTKPRPGMEYRKFRSESTRKKMTAERNASRGSMPPQPQAQTSSITPGVNINIITIENQVNKNYVIHNHY